MKYVNKLLILGSLFPIAFTAVGKNQNDLQDIQPPEIRLIRPPSGTFLRYQDINITIACRGYHGAALVSIDDHAAAKINRTTADGEWWSFHTKLHFGQNKFSVKVKDANGNMTEQIVVYQRLGNDDAEVANEWKQEFGTFLPEHFSLQQNYPNPFNPSTTFCFDVPEAERVKLEVFNLMGQLVQTLINEQISAGRHELLWQAVDQNGRPLPSGTYMYRLQAGSFHQVRKMVLAK